MSNFAFAKKKKELATMVQIGTALNTHHLERR